MASVSHEPRFNERWLSKLADKHTTKAKNLCGPASLYYWHLWEKNYYYYYLFIIFNALFLQNEKSNSSDALWDFFLIVERNYFYVICLLGPTWGVGHMAQAGPRRGGCTYSKASETPLPGFGFG